MVIIMGFGIIVAVDDKNGISEKGNIPWGRINEDLARFQKITIGDLSLGKSAIVSGRKTQESLPNGFLEDRINIAVSSGTFDNPKIVVARSLDQALRLAEIERAKKTWIIGGEGIYREAIAHKDCEELYVTRVEGDHNCDKHLPIIGSDYEETDKSEEKSQDKLRFKFIKYLRVR